MKAVGEIPNRKILVTADVVELYPSIPHDGDLEVLRKLSPSINSITKWFPLKIS